MACFPQGISHLPLKDSYSKSTFAASHPLFVALLGKQAHIKSLKAFTGCLEGLPIEALSCALPGPWNAVPSMPGVKRWDLNQSHYVRNMRNVEIAFKTSIADIFVVDTTGCLALLRDLLAQMSDLRSLKLDIKFSRNGEIFVDEIDDFNLKSFFIKDAHWPRLEKLELSGYWSFIPDDLIRFLRRHGQTIRHLGLAYEPLLIASGTESWIDIFEIGRKIMPLMRTCSLSKLTEFNQPLNHLNYLPISRDVISLDDYIDCKTRRIQLDALEQLAVGKCAWGDNPDDLQKMLPWLKKSWHDWEAMDRGPKTWAERDEIEALKRRQQDEAEALKKPPQFAGSLAGLSIDDFPPLGS